MKADDLLRFVVRYFRWLARVPLAPQLFDAFLLTWTALFHRETLRAIEALEAAALEIPGVSTAPHRLGGLGFVHGGHEFAHVHGSGLLDVKLNRERAAEVVAAGRAEPHHVFGPSAWVSLQMRTLADGEVALALLQAGLEIHLKRRRMPNERPARLKNPDALSSPGNDSRTA